jgi:hypothetical protein
MKINYSLTELVKHITKHRDVVGIKMPVSYRQMNEGMSERRTQIMLKIQFSKESTSLYLN